nr:LOW QUALITY PROTEIN: WD repeat-containing protein 49-like [Globicephala melas]
MVLHTCRDIFTFTPQTPYRYCLTLTHATPSPLSPHRRFTDTHTSSTDTSKYTPSPLRQRSTARSPLEPHPVASHKEPTVCCQYNPTFRQVVSYLEASVVKVWDFETGILLCDFIEAQGNAGIRCLTFDSSGRGLVTGGRDGCLKIWSYNNGPCLHTWKHDEKQSEVCDYTYLKLSQNKCIIAVGWDRRINVYFDTPCDFHHFRKPKPHWQDDVNHGQKEDILCVAQCPPILLATSSYDGEIIIWNVISGHMHCKLNTPSPCDGTEYGERRGRAASTATVPRPAASDSWHVV